MRVLGIFGFLVYKEGKSAFNTVNSLFEKLVIADLEMSGFAWLA